MSRAAAALLAAVVLLATLAGPAPATASAGRAPATRPHVTQMLVFLVENHSRRQMRRDMPWLDRLGRRYGYATRYHGITHPSLPNYLAIAGGDTFGVTDDAPPSAHPITRPSVFGRTLRAGRTATTYAEGMTSRCQQVDGGRYAVRHNPWTYFRHERRLCRRHDVPLRRLARDVDAGTLPRVGLVVPDLCHDAHDCSLAQADRWLRRRVGAVLAGPDFASGHLAVVVTADEDDGSAGNRVLTVVAHPDLRHVVVRRTLTHYALSRSYAEAAGIPPLGHARGSRSLLAAFGLR
ncbi:MAG TPA: alkaline phosphatase family protein [Nocardioides sp.]|nr:alkaline phosphatase family protein [Nocardioides sp.]